MSIVEQMTHAQSELAVVSASANAIYSDFLSMRSFRALLKMVRLLCGLVHCQSIKARLELSTNRFTSSGFIQ